MTHRRRTYSDGESRLRFGAIGKVTGYRICTGARHQYASLQQPNKCGIRTQEPCGLVHDQVQNCTRIMGACQQI